MKLGENVKQMLAAGFQQWRLLCFCLILVLYLSHCPLSFPAPDLHALGLNCLRLSSGTWITVLIQEVCFHLDSFPSFMWGVYVCAAAYLHTCASCLGPGAAPALGLEQSLSLSMEWPQVAKNSPQTGFPVGALVCNSHSLRPSNQPSCFSVSFKESMPISFCPWNNCRCHGSGDLGLVHFPSGAIKGIFRFFSKLDQLKMSSGLPFISGKSILP